MKYRAFAISDMSCCGLLRSIAIMSLLSVVLGIFVADVLAAVGGKCSSCHSMHYSQGGEVMPEWGESGPYHSLLTTDCIGCHMGTNTGGDTPYIMSDVAPLYDATGTEISTNTLAGGSFFWVAGGDHTKGHNVYGLTSPDPYLPTPPSFTGEIAAADGSVPGGGSWPAGTQVTCAGIYGCHGTHNLAMMEAAIQRGHHKGLDGAIVNPGTTPAEGYRMLIGIAGYEDPEWELTPTNVAHNQYKGVDQATDNSAISSLCMRCHNDFHVDSGTSWLLHPIDYDLGNESVGAEVRDYGGVSHLYRVDVPVASLDVNSPISQVTFAGDTIITCMTCHRSHGSPYDKLLRWDYVNTNDGCTVCHTSKD